MSTYIFSVNPWSLRFFLLLSLVNNGAMNMGAHDPFLFLVFKDQNSYVLFVKKMF